ncbi:NF-kappa-B-repressing factor [Hydra vulgaris]|uniref:NF-kappa-B-repressing factor n=1 Tax=Hydra vulgaris TaxID=6087 RepID=A0ABM4CIQ2_HYDVU
MGEEYLGIPRLMWEADHEWRARKAFIDTNKHHYNGDHLASLSMSWANWRFMGCSYGPEVQEILTDCNTRVPREIEEEIDMLIEIATPKVKFVKASNENLGTRTGPPSQAIDGDVIVRENFKDLIQKPDNSDELVSGLILYINEKDDNSNPISILQESVQKCKRQIYYIDKGFINNEIHMDVFIDNIYIAHGSGPNQKVCKQNTAASAFELLKYSQGIIYKKDLIKYHESVSTISKSNLIKSTYYQSPKLQETNLGNQLLRKMGWSGAGGLGKDGCGISDPVFVEGADGRKGIGHEFTYRSVRSSSVEESLLSFLHDSSKNEIRFSSDLTKEDRALVHRLCQKYHLKHRSFGKEGDRYLLVSKIGNIF